MRASSTLFATLSALPALQDINPLSTTTARIYPMIAREQASNHPPYLVYNDSVSSNPELTLEEFTGHEHVRVQIDVYHTSFIECQKLADLIVWQLDALPDSEYISNLPAPNPDNNLSRRIVEFYMWQSYCN